MRRTLMLIPIILAILPATALAQRQTPKHAGRHKPEKLFQRGDKNGDGQISRDEWQRRPKAFDHVDQNHDGFISRDEAQTAARHRAERVQRGAGSERAVQRLDKNNDGQISRDEWLGDPGRFDRLDRNHDGVITRDELPQGRHRRRAPEGSDATPPVKPPQA